MYRKVCFNNDGKYLAASSDATCIDIFNVAKGGQAYRIKTSPSQEILSWHPKKMLLAYIDYGENERKSLDKTEESYIHLFYQ